MQYPIWKKARESLTSLSKKGDILAKVSDVSDPTARCAEARAFYAERMKLIEDCCSLAAPNCHQLLLKGVTEGLSYDILAAREVLPVSRAEYYEKYRMFFWIMNRERE